MEQNQTREALISKIRSLEAEIEAEKRHAEGKLETSEELYRLVVEGAMDAIVITQDGLHKFSNSRIETLTGHTAEEFKKMFYLDIIHPEDRSMVKEMYEKGLRKEPVQTTYSIRILTKSGDTLWMQVNLVFLQWKNRPAILTFLKDITGHKNLEKQYLQAQKMEAIGTLAGGVSHDFNNLLTAILGNADILLRDINEDNPMREPLEDIKAAGQSAANLTRHLLAFSRKQIAHPEVLNLNQVIKDLEKMIGRIIGEDIVMKTLLSPDPGRVKIDPGHLEQVIMNLVANARDAMSLGGNLTLETADVVLDSDFFLEHGVEAQSGAYVMLAVSDTGIGMDEKTRSRVFEPFFKTKDEGKGTGLGLSTVYGIVKQANGFVWVYSEPANGSTFKVYLPRIVKAEIEIHEEKESAKSSKASGIVLLVEDNEAVRKLANKILSTSGYEVMEACDGVEALKVSRNFSGAIDILITDVIMPRINGHALANQLRFARPELKVLFMSGYTDRRIIQSGMPESGGNFLQKPFTPEMLSNKVRALLDRPADE